MFTKHIPSSSEAINEQLKKILDLLELKAKKYIDISASSQFYYGNELDKEKLKLRLKAMNRILDKIPSLKTNKSNKLIYKHVDDFCRRIESLVEDVKDNIICKAEIFMWLGLERQKEDCFKILPKGFKYKERILLAEEKYLFEGKAYIFEGEVQPGFDESGLVDPFIQVFLGTSMRQTQIKKQVLVPIWDQTLTFYNMYLYGAREHIKKYPPTILVQMFDKDAMSSEFVGREIVVPEISFLHDSVSKTVIDSQFKNVAVSKLFFYFLRNQDEILGRILAAFQLTEIIQPVKVSDENQILPIPPSIRPYMESYKIEVMFWGVRELKRINLLKINQPKISFYCGNKTIESQVIENARKCSNFKKPISSVTVNLPSQDQYPEPFCLKLFDSRKFGVYVFAGISISETTSFLFSPMTAEERENRLTNIENESKHLITSTISNSEDFVGSLETDSIKKNKFKTESEKNLNCWRLFSIIFKYIFQRRQCWKLSKSQYSLISNEEEEDESDFDWWTKFYASINDSNNNARKENVAPSQRHKLKIYPNELESQAEFKGFSDILTTFEIFKGKRTGDEVLDEQLTTALFKGAVKIYKWPPINEDLHKYVTPNGRPVKDGVFISYPDNASVQYVLRIYCIRGINLRPKDLNGKSDPYIQIQLGQKIVSDRENYVPKDINPIFGRCFEFQTSFPENTSVIIRIFDYDMASSDDLIGQTKIDLENRFYTKHRAMCGIPEAYYT